MKHAWKLFLKYGMLSILLVSCVICMLKPTKVYALSVTPVNVKMYTTSGTPVFATPDVYSGVVVYLERFVNVTVTGITDNGFYQVDLNGNYYIPGPYLVGQIEPVKTEKQKALENLDKFAQAYRTQLEFMKDYSTSFGLLDVTGDGIPELFDLSGKEIYTYHDGRAVMMYYSEYPVDFYIPRKIMYFLENILGIRRKYGRYILRMFLYIVGDSLSVSQQMHQHIGRMQQQWQEAM